MLVSGLVWSDLRSRYAGSSLGLLWSVVQPLATIVIYVLVFSQVLGARLGGDPSPFRYTVFLCAGLLPWTAFQEIVTRSTTAFPDHAPLLRQVRLPQLSLHAYLFAAAGLNLVFLALPFLVLVALLGEPLHPALLAWPVLLVLQLVFAAGLGLAASVVHVFVRDTSAVVGIVLPLWFWLTPVVYPLEAVPEAVRPLLAWNPLLHFARAHQVLVLDGRLPDLSHGLVLVACALLAAGLGLGLHRRAAARILDEI